MHATVHSSHHFLISNLLFKAEKLKGKFRDQMNDEFCQRVKDSNHAELHTSWVTQKEDFLYENGTYKKK